MDFPEISLRFFEVAVMDTVNQSMGDIYGIDTVRNRQLGAEDKIYMATWLMYGIHGQRQLMAKRIIGHMVDSAATYSKQCHRKDSCYRLDLLNKPFDFDEKCIQNEIDKTWNFGLYGIDTLTKTTKRTLVY